MDIPISSLRLRDALESLRQSIGARQGGYVCFVNVHTLTESTRHAELKAALQGARWSFPDGMPLVWVSRLLDERIPERVCGPDFMAAALTALADEPQGFIGGAPGQSLAIAEGFGLKRAIHYSPEYRPFSTANAGEDWRKFVALCPGGQAPGLVWVGLGAPKQELWMKHVSTLAPQTIFLGVGAAFDFLAGTKARAPAWARRAGLEWAHRLVSEPGRLGMRYLTSNARFGWLVAKELLK